MLSLQLLLPSLFSCLVQISPVAICLSFWPALALAISVAPSAWLVESVPCLLFFMQQKGGMSKGRLGVVMMMMMGVGDDVIDDFNQ